MNAKAQHTPGPWAWFGNANGESIYLATTHSGRRYVMGFQRWGMKGAQPTFQPAKSGLIPAKELLKFEVGDRSIIGIEQARTDGSVYRYDICGIDCADARLIAAAPELLDALIGALDIIEDLHTPGEVDEELEALDRQIRAAIAKATGAAS